MNNKEVYEIVRKHFPENEFALMQEVRDAAGFGASRSADYMAMNLWPSRGLSLHGIEQKSFRSDWTKELRSPEKADMIFKYCDFWWLLTTAEGVAKIDEIPEQWGWMRIEKGKVKVIKQAPKLTPCIMDRGFLAALMKRAVSKEGYIKADSIEERIAKIKLDAENAKNYKLDRLQESNQVLQVQFNDFRKFTGIDIGHIDSWRQPAMEKIGGAVNFISKGGSKSLIESLISLESSADRIVTSIKANLETVKQLQIVEEPKNEH